MNESNTGVPVAKKSRKKLWLGIFGVLMLLGIVQQFFQQKEIDARKEAEDRRSDSIALDYANRKALHDSLMRTDKAYADSVQVADKRRADSLLEQRRKDSIDAFELDRRQNPENHVDVDFSWHKGGFGSVALATIKFNNKSLRTCVNPTVLVTFFSDNGTILSTRKEAVYVTIPPGKRKKSDELNLGFVNKQASRARAELIGATWD